MGKFVVWIAGLFVLFLLVNAAPEGAVWLVVVANIAGYIEATIQRALDD